MTPFIVVGTALSCCENSSKVKCQIFSDYQYHSVRDNLITRLCNVQAAQDICIYFLTAFYDHFAKVVETIARFTYVCIGKYLTTSRYVRTSTWHAIYLGVPESNALLFCLTQESLKIER